MLDLDHLKAFGAPYTCTFVVLFLVTCIALPYLPRRSVYDQFPRVGNPSLLPKFLGKSPGILFSEGYKQFNSPFVVKWWAKDYLLLPPAYLSDIGRLRSENAVFLKNFSDAVNLHHSIGRLYESNRMGDVLRKGMNPVLHWRGCKGTETLIRIAHRVVSRFLAGEELARSESFISLSQDFGDSCFTTGLITAQLPVGPLRPIFAWLLAQWHKVLLARVMRETLPVVQARMNEAAGHRDASAPPQSYHDSIEWAIRLNDPPTRTAKVISLEMLHILQAAAGAPGTLITETIYQILMGKDRYLPELLEEIKNARSIYGITNGITLHMPKMDSFLMEVNRMFPVGGVTAARTIVAKPVILHDGTVLPIGTRIGFPCKAIQRDERLYPTSSKFRAWRFLAADSQSKDHRSSAAHPRTGEDNQDDEQIDSSNDVKDISSPSQHRYKASSTSTTYLPFGYGAHSCPGRFFAIKLAKLILISLLENYDIRWPDDDAQKAQKHAGQRPTNVEVEGQFLPNMEQKLQFRSKTGISLVYGNSYNR